MTRSVTAVRPRSISLAFGALILIGGGLGASNAACAAGQGVQTSSPLSAVQMFDVAEKAKAAGHLDDAAAIYDALAHDPDAQIRAEAHFRKGMMLADARRYADAAIEFRKLLDEHPDALRVRLELARMLAAMGREADARRELRQAEAGHLPAEVAASVDRFSQALQSRKPFGGSFEIALAPDSNINRATQARTLDTVIAPLTLSQDARAKSGLGFQASGQGFARIDIAPDLALLPRISGEGVTYQDHDFDDISASALIGLEYQRGSDRWTPSIGETWRWYGGKGYADTSTATLSWLHPLNRTTQLTTNFSASRADYLVDDLEDGEIYNGGLQVEHALGPRSGFSVSGSVTRQTARDPGFATWAGGGSLLGWREFGSITAFLSADVARTVGDERLFLFPNRRFDWLLSTHAGFTVRKLAVAGFAPLIRVGYERNMSTVGIYDYRRLFTNVGIVRAF